MEATVMKKSKIIKFSVVFASLVSGLTLGVAAADTSVNIAFNGGQTSDSSANMLQMLLMLSLIALAPSIIIMMSSFTRVIIVLSFVRSALGLQQTPPNQVLVGIAIFLSLFIMSPVISEINKDAYQPLTQNQITTQQALKNALVPIRSFMFKNTEDASLNSFLKMANMARPKSLNDIPSTILIPAFTISELKRAFIMGFLIYLPFLVIDLIVSSTLMSMGMMMMPPMMISLPLKLALFVLVDGWSLTVSSLVSSFKT
jgi:flagellar biosynthetic protein FliP